MLLEISYGVPADHITGLPKWAKSQHFDIVAKAVDTSQEDLKSLTRKQRNAMLAVVLGQRFSLVAHKETNNLPVYHLVLAKSGSKLTAAPTTEQNSTTSTVQRTGGLNYTDGEIVADAVPISAIVSHLSTALGRDVIDETGLTGRYSFTLKWVPEGHSINNLDAGQDADLASIFTALQEQLGLKLEPTKGDVEILIVDQAVLPTEN